MLVYPIYTGIVGLVVSDQQIDIGFRRNRFQCLGQKLWPQFGSSTGAGDFSRQLDFNFIFLVFHNAEL